MTIHPSPSHRRESSTRRRAFPFLFCVCLVLSGLLTVRASATPPDFIYLQSNDTRAGKNAIYAYYRAANGTVTTITGSPFLTGGTGNLSARDADQTVLLNPDHSLLFAVNSGSDTITVMHVNFDGSLTPVTGSPFPAGGVMPVSIGLAGNRLWVANDGNTTLNVLPNYTGFVLGADGSLMPIPNSTHEVPDGSQPSQAMLMPQGNLLFGADFAAAKLQAFHVTPEGTLEQSPNMPLATQSPLGLAVHPTQSILYVGYPFASQMGIFTFDETGTLTPVKNVGNSGMGICWVTVTRDGKYLYSGNTADRSVSLYDLADPLNPVERQHLVLKGLGETYQLGLNPTSEYLYVVTQHTGNNLTGSALHTLHLAADGTMTEPGSALVMPALSSTLPEGMAISQPPTNTSGQVVLQGFAPTGGPTPVVTFAFRPADNSPGFTRQVPLAANGSFALTGIPPLRYNVWVKGAKWLAQTIAGDTTQGDAVNLVAQLPGGDANNDNMVDMGDFALLVNAYRKTYDVNDPNASAALIATDFSGDGTIDIADFGILVTSYGLQGDL